jgi:hypothetical protein
MQAKEQQTTALDTFDDLIADAGRGTENIRSKDVRPPRIVLCQSGSPQRKEGNEKQIPGLQELDLFNSLSGEIYGRSLTFTVIKMLGTHWVEFNKDLQVVDRDVPEDDPRAQWTENEDGERVKPVATQFYDYIVWLTEHHEVCALSFKSTQIKNALKLNGLLKNPLKTGGKILVNPPAWARTYVLTTTMQQDKKYAWAGYNLATAPGITPLETRQHCSILANDYKGAKFDIERDENDVEQQQEANGSEDAQQPATAADDAEM